MKVLEESDSTDKGQVDGAKNIYIYICMCMESIINKLNKVIED